tara:strand:+ start:12717 stop:12977 length:261 start_codon:yes stop_codon:yes gene_type:complete
VEDGLWYMLWMFELSAMMFVLMFSETERLKSEIRLEQEKQELILKLEEIMKMQYELRRGTELNDEIPYVIPEIRSPRRPGGKNVDK